MAVWAEKKAVLGVSEGGDGEEAMGAEFTEMGGGGGFWGELGVGGREMKQVPLWGLAAFRILALALWYRGRWRRRVWRGLLRVQQGLHMSTQRGCFMYCI